MKNKAEVRLSVSDILNQTLYFYQNANSDVSFIKANDQLRFTKRFGTTVNFVFGYTL
jgi:hypothetical protein